jgi:hypothetical protein
MHAVSCLVSLSLGSSLGKPLLQVMPERQAKQKCQHFGHFGKARKAGDNIA